MNRRSFFAAAAAGFASLAFARKFILALAVPVLYGDAYHDDTLALRAWAAGLPVNNPDGTPLGGLLEHKAFRLRETIVITRKDQVTIRGCYFDCTGLQFTERAALYV